jgi:hypothetical protein
MELVNGARNMLPGDDRIDDYSMMITGQQFGQRQSAHTGRNDLY